MNNAAISSYLAMIGVPPEILAMLGGGGAAPTVGKQPQLAQNAQGIGVPGQGQSTDYSYPSWIQNVHGPSIGMGGGSPGGGGMGGGGGGSGAQGPGGTGGDWGAAANAFMG